MRRRAMTLIESLIGIGLALVVCGIAFEMWRFGVVSVGSTVSPQVGLQMASRKAMVDFIKEIQECIEVARPLPGTTTDFIIARDKVNDILSAYLVKNDADSAAAKVPLYDLYVDHKPVGKPSTPLKMLGKVERCTFTGLSPGLVQIHLDVHEQDRSYALLTAVRTRNILGEGNL